MNKQREIRRLKKLQETKKELIEMLGSDSPSYVQKSILDNLDRAIAEKQNQLNQI